MGEPLNNYEALRQAVLTLTGPVFRVSPSHITISTVSTRCPEGLPPPAS